MAKAAVGGAAPREIRGAGHGKAPTIPTQFPAKPSLFSECLWTLLAGLLTSVLGALFMMLLWQPFWMDDFQEQFMPCLVDVHRALGEGSFPLISTCSWQGAQLGGEYLFGIFSVFNLGVLQLVFSLGMSLRNTAAAIVLIYLAVCGAGAFRVGRAMALTRPNALVPAFAAALNGWMLAWGVRAWVSFLIPCAWLGWAWWGLLIAARPRYGVWRFLPAGLFLYLLFAGAHPHVDLMIALVTAWLVLGRLFAGQRLGKIWRLARRGTYGLSLRLAAGRTVVARLWPVAAAWALGLSLASPAIAMLMETIATTVRAHHDLPGRDLSAWSVPLWAFFGLAVSAFQARWPTWSGMGLRSCFDVYNGFVPAVALLAILVRSGRGFLRRHGWEMVLLLAVGFLCCRGYFGNFR